CSLKTRYEKKPSKPRIATLWIISIFLIGEGGTSYARKQSFGGAECITKYMSTGKAKLTKQSDVHRSPKVKL
ncbi:hypothetical protein, partial [Heyndrickxia ginsengihumi]|uniref:hypothetical protein n=1 Tax=Heyndrickxia ginsengihumi TaxID=363870 RepID=UPI00204070CA